MDKRSFINAKQSQIHQQRIQRQYEIDNYKFERSLNDGMLQRIDGLLAALGSHKQETDKRSPDELLFQAVMESASNSELDAPPHRYPGIHPEMKEQPSYSKMMATLVDQVKAKVDEDKTEDRFAAYVAELKVHKGKIEELQEKLQGLLDDLERESSKKITSENIRVGFDASYFGKPTVNMMEPPPKEKARKTKKVQAAQVLNPKATGARDPLIREDGAQTSGADADVDEPLPDSDEEADDVEPSEVGKEFGEIKLGNYKKCLEFITQNPKILAEKETDGLLVMAFNAAIEEKDALARQYVHQALLIQYCRALDRDGSLQNGVRVFFKRVSSSDHPGRHVFLNDVEDTFTRIKTRAKELETRRLAEDVGTDGVEQIQLHAVDPNTTINIIIPPKESEKPEEIEARKLFDAFPPGLQRALEGGFLVDVNKVLGKMSVEEAEEVVGQLSAVSCM